MLNPDEFKRAIQAIDALGATPAVLAQVIKMANDPNSDLESMCALMKNDGSLAADMIRISNSPYYAPAIRHSNLTSAVNSIGLREMLKVVNLSLARQLFARDLPGYGVTARDYWGTSISAALVMESLAQHAGLNSEDAYTIGILHAVGRVLINRVIEEKGGTIHWEGHQPIADWERGSVGFDYAEAGALLLEHWRFPPETCDIVRRQLVPEENSDRVTMLGALQFMQRLIALTGVEFDRNGWLLPAEDSFVRASGLSSAVVFEIVAECRDDLQRIVRRMNIPGK